MSRYLFGFKLPMDAYVLALPVTYASLAFLGLCFRMPTLDPETSNLQYYEDEKHSAKAATYYDNQFKSLFDARIKSHKLGVFQNWMPGSPQ